MPMIVPVEGLVPGLILQEDVVAENGSLLLARGVPLSDSRIASLRRLGILSVRVKLADSETDQSERGPIPRERAERVRSQLQTLCSLAADKRALPLSLFQDLAKTLNSVIDAVFDAGELLFSELKHISRHDAYTYDHSWMVCVMALAIARQAVAEELLSPLDYLSRLSLGLGSLLHDLGKVMIPVEVLNKPTPLSTEEFELMKLHPQFGLDILRHHDAVMPIARGIVLHHHQRWDGRGYGPKSGLTLQGLEIPHLVRIASVADAYDALISDRPYRPGSLPGEAMTVISQAAGMHFDPHYPSLLRKLVSPYPVGCALLSHRGAIGIVETPAREGNPVDVYIIAALDGRERSALGKHMAFDKTDILFGGNSLPNLAARLKHAHGGHLPHATEEMAPEAVPPWDGMVYQHFGDPLKRHADLS